MIQSENPQESENDKMKKIVSGIVGAFGKSLGIALDEDTSRKMFLAMDVQTFVNECISKNNMTLKEAILSAKEKFNLEDEYEFSLTIKIAKVKVSDFLTPVAQ